MTAVEKTAPEAAPKAADFSWNPLVAITGPEHARALAGGGAWAAGLLGLNYLLTLAAAVATGPSALVVGVCLLVAAAAAGLGFLIWRDRPLWACAVVLAWLVAETLGGLWGLVRGGFGGRSLSLAAELLALLFAVQALRGALALRKA
jgi:hypothetical protein